MASVSARKQFSYFLSSLFGLWILAYPVSSSSSVTIAPNKKGRLDHKVVCQGEELKIRCFNSSYAIVIESGNYGRTLTGDVVCRYDGHESDFDFYCGENDVKDKLIDLCQNKKRCRFVVGKSLFGDRCRGQAYLNIIYRCVEKERKKNRKKTTPALPSTLPTTTTTTQNSTNITILNTTESPTQNVSGLINILPKTNGKPGIVISLIMWIVYIKERWSSFRTIFFISTGASFGLFLVICMIYLLLRRRTRKRKRRHSCNNKELHQQLNPTSTLVNGDVKKTTELDSLSNTFPAPISTLPPPPDDMIYPSPSPEMMNATRPPPPPVPRVSSLDDISKFDQDRNSKNVQITRSLSMRTRPSDYYSKDLNYEKFNPKLHTIQCCTDINEVLTNKESAMYMNPMYENGHIKEVTC